MRHNPLVNRTCYSRLRLLARAGYQQRYRLPATLYDKDALRSKNMADFRELRPASWQELKDWYYALSLGWVFRGQRKAEWEISSSLERSMSGVPLGPIEIPMVKQFTSRLHHYRSEEAA